jgi:hypothetical protein
MPATRTKKSSNKKNNKTRKYRVFKKKDFYSGDGFQTSVWGPALWHSLHTISFNYPIKPTEDDKKSYKAFIISLKNVLPCKHCRMNLKNNFKELPLRMSDMKNRETFSKYIYHLHELINKMLHKNSKLTYCDVRERYEHFRSRCSTVKPIILNKSIEKGCSTPLYGEKSKCIIKIVPKSVKGATMQIDRKCIKTKKRHH